MRVHDACSKAMLFTKFYFKESVFIEMDRNNYRLNVEFLNRKKELKTRIIN